MSQNPAPEKEHDDHAQGHAHAPIPGEPWANVALAIFIAVFFCAGVYSAARGVSEHEESADAEHSGHSAEAPAMHGKGPAHEPAAAEEKPAPGEAPHEGK